MINFGGDEQSHRFALTRRDADGAPVTLIGWRVTTVERGRVVRRVVLTLDSTWRCAIVFELSQASTSRTGCAGQRAPPRSKHAGACPWTNRWFGRSLVPATRHWDCSWLAGPTRSPQERTPAPTQDVVPASQRPGLRPRPPGVASGLARLGADVTELVDALLVLLPAALLLLLRYRPVALLLTGVALRALGVPKVEVARRALDNAWPATADQATRSELPPETEP